MEEGRQLRLFGCLTKETAKQLSFFDYLKERLAGMSLSDIFDWGMLENGQKYQRNGVVYKIYNAYGMKGRIPASYEIDGREICIEIPPEMQRDFYLIGDA